MRERVTVVVPLSVSLSLLYFGEGAVFRVETYISNIYFGEKSSGTSAVTIYAGTAQSLKGLARDLLACVIF